VTTHVSLIDHTSKHPPGPGILAEIALALTVQCHSHFCPAWGLASATVIVGGSGEPIHLFDNPDVAGALGYHDVDPVGNPYAHVFTDPSFEQGGSDWTTGAYSISSVISHELLEMLGDAAANRFAFDGKARLYAQEACDAVESSSYGITGVPVSNFVLPAWFNAQHAGPYYHLSHLHAPFSLESGGYTIVERASTEQQQTAFVFDPMMPAWRQVLKETGYGRSYWRAIQVAMRAA